MLQLGEESRSEDVAGCVAKHLTAAPRAAAAGMVEAAAAGRRVAAAASGRRRTKREAAAGSGDRRERRTARAAIAMAGQGSVKTLVAGDEVETEGKDEIGRAHV